MVNTLPSVRSRYHIVKTIFTSPSSDDLKSPKLNEDDQVTPSASTVYPSRAREISGRGSTNSYSLEKSLNNWMIITTTTVSKSSAVTAYIESKCHDWHFKDGLPVLCMFMHACDVQGFISIKHFRLACSNKRNRIFRRTEHCYFSHRLPLGSAIMSAIWACVSPHIARFAKSARIPKRFTFAHDESNTLTKPYSGAYRM